MGNCLKSCFGKVKTKRTDYFSGRFNNSSIDIEFENLIDDDEVQQYHAVLTDDERNLLQNRRYTDLVQEQQKIDAKLDKELELEEENARLEEEAYNAAKREASRATKRARLLEMEKRRLKTQQSNGSTKAWLGDDAGDWEVATEDDFEAFLDTVKAKSETVRASVASMLNTTTPTTTTTTNQAVTKQPTSPTASPTASPMVQVSIHTSGQSVKPSYSGSAKTKSQSSISSSPSLTSTMTSVVQHDTLSVQFNSLKTQGGKLGSLDGSGQVVPEQVSNKPDVVHQASRRVTHGVGQNDVKEEEGTEASKKLSYYIKPGSKSSNHHDDDDSDVEWEADFVSADSPSEPINITPQSSPAKLPASQSIGSSNSTTIPSRHESIRTGLPSSSRTNGSALANGQLPYKHEPEEIETSVTEGKMKSNGGSNGVKAKKTLDIDIDKFLEELDFDT